MNANIFPLFTVEVLKDLKEQPKPSTASPSTVFEDEERPHRSLLPATWRTKDDDIAIPRPSSFEWLEKELLVPQLNDIHSLLWLVGRPMFPRPLHYQLALRREIFITEKMHMHLVWSNGCIFMKPIPRFLLDTAFWKKYLIPSGAEHWGGSHSPVYLSGKQVFTANTNTDLSRRSNPSTELAACAAGFLFSWAALIAYESDHKIAVERGLIPKEVDWLKWKLFTEDILRHPLQNIYPNINKRFHYGELRLGRLNKIYRFRKLKIRGFSTSYTRYADLLNDYFTYLASVLAYVVIVMTAMQVGLATTKLQENTAFQNASYGFTLFSILVPLLLIFIMFSFFIWMVLWNIAATIRYEAERFRHMGIEPRDSKVGKIAGQKQDDGYSGAIA